MSLQPILKVWVPAIVTVALVLAVIYRIDTSTCERTEVSFSKLAKVAFSGGCPTPDESKSSHPPEPPKIDVKGDCNPIVVGSGSAKADCSKIQNVFVTLGKDQGIDSASRDDLLHRLEESLRKAKELAERLSRMVGEKLDAAGPFRKRYEEAMRAASPEERVRLLKELTADVDKFYQQSVVHTPGATEARAMFDQVGSDLRPPNVKAPQPGGGPNTGSGDSVVPAPLTAGPTQGNNCAALGWPTPLAGFGAPIVVNASLLEGSDNDGWTGPLIAQEIAVSRDLRKESAAVQWYFVARSCAYHLYTASPMGNLLTQQQKEATYCDAAKAMRAAGFRIGNADLATIDRWLARRRENASIAKVASCFGG